MSLRDLLASQSVPTARPTEVTMPPQAIGSGLHHFITEIVTDQRAMQVSFSSPEIRLSDHFNGSSPFIEFDLPGTGGHGLVWKRAIVFVVPVAEPEHRRTGAWQPTSRHTVRIGLGPYEVEGAIHLDVGRDPVVGFRLLDREFIPITDVTIFREDELLERRAVVFVNRSRIDIVALPN